MNNQLDEYSSTVQPTSNAIANTLKPSASGKRKAVDEISDSAQKKNKNVKKYTVTEWRTEGESMQPENVQLENGYEPKHFDTFEEAKQHADSLQNYDIPGATGEYFDIDDVKYVLVEINHNKGCKNADCYYCDEGDFCCPYYPLAENIVYQAFDKQQQDYYERMSATYHELQDILNERPGRWELTLELVPSSP